MSETDRQSEDIEEDYRVKDGQPVRQAEAERARHAVIESGVSGRGGRAQEVPIGRYRSIRDILASPLKSPRHCRWIWVMTVNL